MGTLSAPTRSELITNIRYMLGEPTATNSRWTDAELGVYINEGIRRYFGEVVQNSEGLFVTTADLNIVSGQEAISLPSDFFEIVRAYRKQNGDNYIHMAYDNSLQESYSDSGVGSGNSFVPSYRLRNDQMILRPVPSFSETAGIKIEYVQYPTTMDISADSLPDTINPVFKHLIEMYAVYKAKVSESIRSNGIDVVSAAAQHLSDAYRQFQNVIQARSHSPEFVKAFHIDSLDEEY